MCSDSTNIERTVALLILDGRLQVETLRQTGERQCRRIADTAGAALGFRLGANAQFGVIAYATLDDLSFEYNLVLLQLI